MANSDKNILITPNVGSSTDDPKVEFTGADSGGSDILTVDTLFDGTISSLSFFGTAGELLNISNTVSGIFFSVNDVSGIPSIEVDDTGLVRLARYDGNVVIGNGTDDATNKLQLDGSATITGNIGVGTASPSNQLHIKSTGDAVIWLEADTDNGAGEDDNAYIRLTQDNLACKYVIGLAGTNDILPNGTSITGVVANYLQLAEETSVGGIQFSTFGALALTIDGQKTAHFQGQVVTKLATTLTPGGATQTVDWDNGNMQIIDLESSSASVAITLSNGNAGGSYVLKIQQDGSSPKAVTWTTTVKWPGGTAPTISTGADAIDIISFVYDGTWYGSFVQNLS